MLISCIISQKTIGWVFVCVIANTFKWFSTKKLVMTSPGIMCFSYDEDNAAVGTYPIKMTSCRTLDGKWKVGLCPGWAKPQFKPSARDMTQ